MDGGGVAAEHQIEAVSSGVRPPRDGRGCVRGPSGDFPFFVVCRSEGRKGALIRADSDHFRASGLLFEAENWQRPTGALNEACQQCGRLPVRRVLPDGVCQTGDGRSGSPSRMERGRNLDGLPIPKLGQPSIGSEGLPVLPCDSSEAAEKGEDQCPAQSSRQGLAASPPEQANAVG